MISKISEVKDSCPILNLKRHSLQQMFDLFTQQIKKALRQNDELLAKENNFEKLSQFFKIRNRILVTDVKLFQQITLRQLYEFVKRHRELIQQFYEISGRLARLLEKYAQVRKDLDMVKEQVALEESRMIIREETNNGKGKKENTDGDNQDIKTLKENNFDNQKRIIPNIAQRKVERPLMAIAKKKKKISKQHKRRIKNARKNSETNIMNQMQRLLKDRVKSSKIVTQAFTNLGQSKDQQHLEKKLLTFYRVFKEIIKSRPRYVNKERHFGLFNPKTLLNQIPEAKTIFEKQEFIFINEFCCIFRRCSFQFLREISIAAILTQKRTKLISKAEVIKRRREVIKAFPQTTAKSIGSKPRRCEQPILYRHRQIFDTDT